MKLEGEITQLRKIKNMVEAAIIFKPGDDYTADACDEYPQGMDSLHLGLVVIDLEEE
jgi:hypothetical protein